MEPHTPSGLRAPPKYCQHNGTMYQHGEIFSAHELLPSRLPNQCVLCSCTEGQIYCGLMTCPEPGCPAPLPLPASCCQMCKGFLVFEPRMLGRSRTVCEAGARERESHSGPCVLAPRDESSKKSAEEDTTQSHRGAVSSTPSTTSQPLSLASHHGCRHSQDPCSGDNGRKRVLGTPAPTGLSAPLGFIPRHFRPKGAGSTTVKIVLKEKHKKELTQPACVHSGKTYSHGEVWHPAFRSFGPLPCILCTCQDGRQDCQRVTCPTEYPCHHPEKVAGKCCKICPEDKADPGHSEISATRCPKVPGRVLVHTSVSPSPDNLHRFALEHEASEQVEIYLWKLVKGGMDEESGAVQPGEEKTQGDRTAGFMALKDCPRKGELLCSE
ncbi:chordin-like protein 2 isoform X1 [Prionailurus iriomotensis]